MLYVMENNAVGDCVVTGDPRNFPGYRIVKEIPEGTCKEIIEATRLDVERADDIFMARKQRLWEGQDRVKNGWKPEGR